MCMVSVVNDYGAHRIPANDWTRSTWNEYQEILRRLEALDAKLGQPECETPDKLAWQQEIEARLARMEALLAAAGSE